VIKSARRGGWDMNGLYYGDGRKLYEKHEDQYIVENYSSLPHNIIAKKLGRTTRSIRSRAKKLGCDPLFRKTKWTEQDKEYILQAYGIIPLNVVAEQLGRNVNDVCDMGKKLGIISWRRKNGKKVTERGYEIIRFDYENDGTKRKTTKVYQHRVVAEQILGRSLYKEEIVHHIDTNKLNNNPENIFVFESTSSHMRAHNKLRRLCKALRKDQQSSILSGDVVFDIANKTYTYRNGLAK
jgi:hypothetical protein